MPSVDLSPPLLDEGILRDANGKVYYRADDYKFDINAAAPETVNPQPVASVANQRYFWPVQSHR